MTAEQPTIVMLTDIDSAELAIRQPIACQVRQGAGGFTVVAPDYWMEGSGKTKEEAIAALQQRIRSMAAAAALGDPANPVEAALLANLQSRVADGLPCLGRLQQACLERCCLPDGYELYRDLDVVTFELGGGRAMLWMSAGLTGYGRTLEHAGSLLLARAVAVVRLLDQRPAGQLTDDQRCLLDSIRCYVRRCGEPEIPLDDPDGSTAVPPELREGELETAELRPGVVWDCPDCGFCNTLNVPHRAVEPEDGDPEVRFGMLQIRGVGQVVCRRCRQAYGARLWCQDDEAQEADDGEAGG